MNKVLVQARFPVGAETQIVMCQTVDQNQITRIKDLNCMLRNDCLKEHLYVSITLPRSVRVLFPKY